MSSLHAVPLVHQVVPMLLSLYPRSQYLTVKTTHKTGPNGNIDWLNCGVDGSGWRPPFVKVSDLISADLSSAIQKGGSPFKACSKYVHLFEQYGAQHGLPPIMLASFALQESSCNPETVGGGGEQGLMQITRTSIKSMMWAAIPHAHLGR
jgi:hypothetical protein